MCSRRVVSNGLSRRDALRIGALAVGSALYVACTPQAKEWAVETATAGLPASPTPTLPPTATTKPTTQTTQVVATATAETGYVTPALPQDASGCSLEAIRAAKVFEAQEGAFVVDGAEFTADMPGNIRAAAGEIFALYGVADASLMAIRVSGKAGYAATSARQGEGYLVIATQASPEENGNEGFVMFGMRPGEGPGKPTPVPVGFEETTEIYCLAKAEVDNPETIGILVPGNGEGEPAQVRALLMKKGGRWYFKSPWGGEELKIGEIPKNVEEINVYRAPVPEISTAGVAESLGFRLDREYELVQMGGKTYLKDTYTKAYMAKIGTDGKWATTEDDLETRWGHVVPRSPSGLFPGEPYIDSGIGLGDETLANRDSFRWIDIYPVFTGNTRKENGPIPIITTVKLL